MGSYSTTKILTHNGKAATLNGNKILLNTETIYYPSFTGGTEIIDGEYSIRVFSANDTLIIADSSIDVEYLLVAGGGGGGGAYRQSDYTQHAGAGGGGGGVLTGTTTLAAGTYPIVIGSGGTKGSYGIYPSLATKATNGGNTTFNSLTAVGGGYGGGYANGGYNGGNGGSGGGAAFQTPTIMGTAGTGTAGQGKDGGAPHSPANYFRGVGGGGGYSTSGGTANEDSPYGSGSGGNGYACNITGGTTFYCAAGGGGGATETSPAGNTGLGGGGVGASTSNAGDGISYGSGGGGGGRNQDGSSRTPYEAGNGAAGVIFIRYKTPTIPS